MLLYGLDVAYFYLFCASADFVLSIRLSCMLKPALISGPYDKMLCPALYFMARKYAEYNVRVDLHICILARLFTAQIRCHRQQFVEGQTEGELS